MFKLAVFDLDGTLLDTLSDLQSAMNFALSQSHFPIHEKDSYKSFVGNGVDLLVARAAPKDICQEDFAKVKALFKEYYSAHSLDDTAPYSGVMDMLKDLKQNGVAVAVLSNKPDFYTKELCNHFFGDLVGLAYGQIENVPIKPDPTVLLQIIKQLGFEQNDCIYIGDTGTDMETGKAAKVYTAGVAWGFRTKEELVSHGANVIVDKATQLTKIVLDSADSVVYNI